MKMGTGLVLVSVLVLGVVAARAEDIDSMPPVVVKTVPEAGATAVDPALAEIRVSYSKDMIAGNYSFVQISKESFPETSGKARYDAATRTFVLPVKLAPGRTYVVWLNKEPYNSFMDAQHCRAVPYLLAFRTAKSAVTTGAATQASLSR